MNNNNYTTTKIDFINFIDKSIKNHGKIHYFRFFGWDKAEVINFLTQIPDDTVITVFPFVSATGRPEDSYLRLSNVFLVTNKSNPTLISDFLDNQYNNSAFTLENGENASLYFKYRVVTLKPDSFK